MPRLIRLAATLTAAGLVAGVSAGGQRGPGSIVGKVKLTVRPRGAPIPTPMYPTRTAGHQAEATIPEIKNVVLYLKGLSYQGPLPVTRAELKQQDETFMPHVVAVTKGSFVDFPNADPFYHNVFSLSGAAAFDLGRYPEGQSRTQRFNKAGIVRVYCHIHSHMSASIVVLDNPYFVIPDNDGSYEIKNVPPGQYTLIGWHERIGERATPVKVDAGAATTMNVSLPVGEAP